jgi:DNA primase
MARYGQDKIEEVRSRADIVEVIGTHVRLRRAGRNFTGLCPFHNEKTPSFSVSAERGFFHCFGCGAGGTVFDFVMRVEALTFPEALQSLARRYGVALPQPETGAGSPVAGERDTLFNANQTAADFYSHVLWNTPDGVPAREYLKTRGITVETAQAFMLGFAPSRPANLAATLGKRNLGEAGLKLGLIKRDERGALYDMFRARLMFPIRDPQGRAIAFGGRVLDDRLPKYINSPESPLYSKARMVYGLHEARNAMVKADRAIIVEGNIDVIALWQAGFKETVASLGTALTAEQLRLLARYTRNLIACFDGDSAGRKASMRALEIFLQAGLLGRGAFIPSGYDPDTLVRERGAESFSEVLDSAELLVDYFLSEQAEAARGSVDARARVAERVAQILRLLANPYEFDLLARKAAAMIGVSEALLRVEARKGATAQRAALPPPPRAIAVEPLGAPASAELGLLGIAYSYPELRAEIFSAQPLQHYSDKVLADLLGFILESTSEPGELTGVITEQLSTRQKEWIAKQLKDLEDIEASAKKTVASHPLPPTNATFKEFFGSLFREKSRERGRELAVARDTMVGLLRILKEPDLRELKRRTFNAGNRWATTEQTRPPVEKHDEIGGHTKDRDATGD